MIYGNIEGIKDSILEKLEKVYDKRFPKELIVDEETIELLCNITDIVGREISIGISRRGNVTAISIGDSTTVEMPIIDIKEKRLSGIKIIHTHPNGNYRLSAIDISALIKLKLDCIVAIGVDHGEYTGAAIGFCNVVDSMMSSEIEGPFTKKELLEYNVIHKILDFESNIKNLDVIEECGERAILVGIEDERSLDELDELAKACNVNVLYKLFQKRTKIDSAFYIGSGKVQELSLVAQTVRANLIIFDDELTGSQLRNIEDATGIKVIDRTTLILEIFAKRARTKEARIQVEIAQLKYRMSRLSGLGAVLSRTGGGIGTRGPGEKKLETDRRHIRDRIYDLNEELEKIKITRDVQRDRRNNIPKISIVGYTNAGKSTLRNKLCEIAMPKDNNLKENVLEADMLFATLDVTTRAIVLPDNRIAALTDTVGFVRKLPHDLVESFKSTLEEVVYSDILIHVVDITADNSCDQFDAVKEVLKELGAEEKPYIVAINKIDKVSEESIEKFKSKYENETFIEISAKNNVNLNELLNLISTNLPNTFRLAEYLIPYKENSMVSFLHRNGKIQVEEYKDNGTYIKAQVDEEVYNKSKKFLI